MTLWLERLILIPIPAGSTQLPSRGVQRKSGARILARTPGSEGFLHVGMREKRFAQIAQDWTVYATGHIRAPRDFSSWNMNLDAKLVGIGDGRPKYDAVESGPKRVGHAHGARLAGGVHRVPSQGRALELLASKANSACLGVGTRIALTQNRIGSAHQPLSGTCVYNQGAERDRMGSFEGACGELKDLAHALFVHRH